MKVEFFRNRQSIADLNAKVEAFLAAQPGRVLRDVRLAYGACVEAGQIDETVVVAVLYDELDADAGRSPWDAHDAQQLQRMDRTRDEIVRARA